MNKFQIVNQLRNNGDSIVTLSNGNSIGATLEFGEKYIRKLRSQRFTIQKDCILLFSWTDNAFKNIKVADIRSITPLAKMLNNIAPEKLIDGR